MLKNRKLLIILIMLTIISLVFVGCSDKKPQEEQQPPAAEKVTNPDVILATTTSTRDSGLLDVLLPVFEKDSGYIIKTIAVGTGAALEMGKKGEADVLMTHAPASEKPLVDEGYVIDYTLLMHNDFIIVGPASDPAGIKNAKDAAEALGLIAKKEALFASRGDDSGTHKAELALWKKAGIEPAGTWYQETGSGMGDTLNIAAEKAGYTLTDRATYLSLQKNLTEMEILFEGDEALFNIYHVMAVNPEKFDKVNYEGAKAFIDFLVSKETQDLIGSYGADKYGQPLFFPDAK